jgi:hypothetical protein
MQVAGLLFAICIASLFSGGVLLLRWWAIADKPPRGVVLPDELIAGVAEGEVRDR